MANTFESRQYRDDSEIRLDPFEFKSAGKKYINQNYKRICGILGIEGEKLGNIKKQANLEKKLPDIQGELSLEQINFYREHYGFPVITQDEYDSIKAQNTSIEATIDEQPVDQVTDIENLGGEMPPDAEAEPNTTDPELLAIDNSVEQLSPEASPDNAEGEVVGVEAPPTEESTSEIPVEGGEADTVTGGESEVNQGTSQLESEDTEPTNPDLEKLQLELSRLVTEAATELSKEQGGAIVRVSDEASKSFEPNLDILYQQLNSNNINPSEPGKLARVEDHTYPGEGELETVHNSIEINLLKEKALEAISDYQQFIEINRNNLRDEKIYNEYRIIEKKAWFHVGRFIHKLGGEIVTLPQERDIQLAHPEVVDIKEYLVNRGKITLDAEDNITHLNIDGNIIELNRPRTIDDLLKAKRPTHILYHSGTPISEDDPTKQNYKGLLIDGLNEDTLELIERVLNKKETVIVDETKPVSEELPEQTSDNVVEEQPTIGEEPETEQVEVSTLEDDNIDTLSDLRLAYARAEEAYNRKRGNDELEENFVNARDAYNAELERVLKLKVSEGQENNIHQMFKDEFLALRDSRIERSQELQGVWEKRLNPIKEKFVNFVIKHKKIISRLNLAVGVAGGALALTGVGIPLAGGLAVARRMVSATLLGVSTGEGIRSLGEDADINSFWGKIKFQAVIPKLVQESLASSEDEFKQVSEDVLKERLGTLEAYYRLNGGKFNDNQQKAYEKVLTELARRVQENVINLENSTISVQPLTVEQLERNKKLYGWEASYELAKIAKSQNIDLSLLSREDYADFAIQNKLMIDDTQLRMSPWQRMCESVDEVRKGDKERQSLINPEADAVFDKFSSKIRQKAGESDRNIDNNIIVRQGTNNSEHWLYFGINQGADSSGDQIFKSYISLQDLNTLTPDKFTDFMKALRDSGYNGDIKVFQDLLSQGIRLNDQIVMHGGSEADAKLGLDVADQFFGDSLAHKSSGIDMKINGKSYSYSQVLAKNIKNSIQDSSSVEEQNSSTEVAQSDRQELSTDRYTSELLNTISDTRIAELDKFRKNRKTATIAGLGLGLLAGGAVHLSDEFNKPDSVKLTDGSDSTTGGATPDTQAPGAGPGSSVGASAPEAGAGVTKTIPDASPAGTGAEATEALRQQAAAAAAEKAQELAQDVSNLDSGETIWSQASKWLGPDASQGQIQEAVEKYLGSIKGQDTIFKLANQTEGGRELLSQWGIDNAGEMAGLSKEQLYEVSKYLGEGKLDGLTELSLDNLDALEQAEYVAPSPTEAPTIEPGSTEPPAPPAGTEATGAKPPAPIEAPVNTSQFTKSLSEAIGANNLTDSQIGSVLEAYSDTEQGRESLYNMIITSEANNSNISDLLTEYNVIDIYDFADLSDNQLYALAQEVGVENLDKLPGFELNEIILSKFEDAPDMVELVKGSKPLDMVNRYIASEVGNLPYDASLGQQILNTYLETPQGKQWLYDAIIINNPDKLNGNQNIQFVEEYFRQKGIKSGADINWLDLTQDRRFPTSIFWREKVLAGGRRIPPLSTLLQPSKMSGIKDVVRQVLTRQ